MERTTRRAVLASIGTAAVAGCLDRFDGGAMTGTDSQTTDDGTDTPTSTTTDRSTETETETPSKTETLRGSQLDGFENFDRWFVLADQGTLSADANDPYAGTQSAHVKSSTGDSFGAIYKAFTEPKDFSSKNLSLAVKLSEPDIAKISVALLAPDRGNMVRMMRTMPGPTDRWVRINFGTTTVKRDPDLSEVQEIRIVCRRRGSDDRPVEFAVDDLRAVDRPKRGRVMLTFDDSHVTHYTNAFEQMQKYGFSGVEGVIAESIYGSDRLDVGMMREMRDAGWDMASHPLTRGTQLPEFTKAKQRKRIEDNKQFLVRKGFPKGARHFLTPQNMVGPNTYDLVRENHETLFTFGGMPNGLPATSNYYYGRINGGNVDGVERMIDFAATYDQLVVINHHTIGPDGIPEEDFVATLDYIDQANVDVVTASDVIDGNLGATQ